MLSIPAIPTGMFSHLVIPIKAGLAYYFENVMVSLNRTKTDKSFNFQACRHANWYAKAYHHAYICHICLLNLKKWTIFQFPELATRTASIRSQKEEEEKDKKCFDCNQLNQRRNLNWRKRRSFKIYYFLKLFYSLF
jgi:hypothetical protein